MLIFKLLVSLTKGNPSLARRPVLVSTLRDGKKMLQVCGVPSAQSRTVGGRTRTLRARTVRSEEGTKGTLVAKTCGWQANLSFSSLDRIRPLKFKSRLRQSLRPRFRVHSWTLIVHTSSRWHELTAFVLNATTIWVFLCVRRATQLGGPMLIPMPMPGDK